MQITSFANCRVIHIVSGSFQLILSKSYIDMKQQIKQLHDFDMTGLELTGHRQSIVYYHLALISIATQLHMHYVRHYSVSVSSHLTHFGIIFYRHFKSQSLTSSLYFHSFHIFVSSMIILYMRKYS